MNIFTHKTIEEILKMRNWDIEQWRTSKDKIMRTVCFIASLSPHNYWRGYEALQNTLTQAHAEGYKEAIEEVRGRIKPFFESERTICKKCGHLSENHYWNGGGRSENSGYDACHTCGCVNYDRTKDFINISEFDEEAYQRFFASLPPKVQDKSNTSEGKEGDK